MQKAQEQARKQSEMNQFIKAQLASNEIVENPEQYDEVEKTQQIDILKEQNKELKQNLNHVKKLYKKSIQDKPKTTKTTTLVQTKSKKTETKKAATVVKKAKKAEEPQMSKQMEQKVQQLQTEELAESKIQPPSEVAAALADTYESGEKD